MAIRLSDDKELVEEIRHKLKENDGYCPCRIEKNDDTKCMCKEFREQEDGECHCGLFVKTKEEQSIPKKIDYTGFENEYIKVLGVSDKNIQVEKNSARKNKTEFWECECKKCNSIFHTASQNIPKIKSCGCSRRYKNAEQEIGNKYGRLTIIDIDWDKTQQKYDEGCQLGVFYKCKCECGNVNTYRLNSIKFGHTKSCGCSKFNNPLIMEDLTGQKFGRLTVINRDLERDEKELRQGKRRGNVHWLCRCDCGNEKLSSVTGWQLKSGHTQSCGCLNSEITAERNRRDSTKINRVFRSKENVKEFIEDDIVRIYGDNNDGSFIVDVDDYYFIKNWFWRKDPKGYWTTNAKKEDEEVYGKKSLRLHQLIAERKYGKYDTKKLFPDHLSRDKSDNRKCNLVLKTNADNMKNRSLSKANTSGKTGVSFTESKGTWTAYITVNYETIYLGDFIKFEDAVNARLFAEKKYGFTCDDKVADYDYSHIENEASANAG